MADSSTEMVFEFDDNLEEAAERLDDFDSKMSEVHEAVAEFSDLSPDELVDKLEESQDMVEGVHEASTMLTDEFENSEGAIGEAVDSLGALEGEMESVLDVQEELSNAISEGNAEQVESLTKNINDQFSSIKEEFDDSMDAVEDKGEEVTEMFEEAGFSIGKHMKEALEPEKVAETMGNTFSDILSGNMEGLATSFAQAADDALVKGIEGMTAGAAGAAAGGSPSTFETATGGAEILGATQEAAATEEMDPDSDGSASPTAGIKDTAMSLGSLAAGPAGLITAIVGALFTLSNQAKEANTKLMKTVSYAELMAAQGEKVQDSWDKASTSVEESVLQPFQETGMSGRLFSEYGAETKDFISTLEGLRGQGEMISDLTEDYESFDNALKSATEQNLITATNLNANISKVASYRGQLKEFGVDLDSIDEHFKQLQESALGADMTAESFFSTIQQMSSQLDLYNYSLSDSTEMLNKISEFMSPEKAQEFTSAMTSGFKEMSSQERMQSIVLNGMEKTRRLIQDEAVEVVRNLKDVGKAQKMLNDMEGVSGVEGAKGITQAMGEMSNEKRMQFLAQVQTQMGESAYKNLTKAANMQSKSKGGVMDLSAASADLGPMEKLSYELGQLKNTFDKDLSDLTPSETSDLGVDQDRLRLLRQIEESAKGRIEILSKTAENIGTRDAVENKAEELGVRATLKDGKIMRTNKRGKIIGEIESTMDMFRAMKQETKESVDPEIGGKKTAVQRQTELTKSILRFLKSSLKNIIGKFSHITNLLESLVNVFVGEEYGEEARKRMEKIQEQRQKFNEKRQKARDRGNKDEAKKWRKRAERARERYKDEMKYREIRQSEKVEEGWVGKSDEIRMFESYKEQDLLGKIPFSEYKKKVKKKRKNLPASAIPSRSGGIGAALAKDKARTLVASEARLNKKLQSDIKEGVTKLGSLMKGNKDSLEDHKKTLKKEGINVNKDGKKALKEAMTEATLKAWRQRRMYKALKEKGMSSKKAEMAAQRAVNQGKAPSKKSKKYSEKDVSTVKDVMKKVLGVDSKSKTTDAKKANDAMIMQSGIPFLDLQAGDMIVDSQDFAETARGGKGQFVSRTKAGKGGGGGPRVVNATFNFNGGDMQKFERKVLSILNQWENGGLSA
jgi:hypothetical protein